MDIKKMNFIFKPIFLLVLFSYTLFANDLIIAFGKNSSVYGNQPSPKQIIDIEKIQKVAKEHNINIKFKAVPWKRALLLLEKGLIDGLINASYKKNRAMYSVYPMLKGVIDNEKRLNDGNTYYIYRHKDSALRWDGKTFIVGGKVGVKEKYAVIGDLKKHPNITIEEFIKNSELIRKLSSKKLDGYAAGYEEAKSLIKKYDNFSTNIVREPLPIRKKEYFLIFSKKTYTKKLKEMEQIWSGLKRINIKNRLDKK